MSIRIGVAAVTTCLAGVLALPIQTARADELGCKVFLCFGASAIGGWQKVPECVPPVQTALRKMLRGWQPYCEFGSASGQGGGAGNYFRTGTEETSCASVYGAGYVPSVDAEFNDYAVGPGLGTGRPDRVQHVCENAATGDRRPMPLGALNRNYVDIFIDNQFYSRTYWDASQAAADASVP